MTCVINYATIFITHVLLTVAFVINAIVAQSSSYYWLPITLLCAKGVHCQCSMEKRSNFKDCIIPNWYRENIMKKNDKNTNGYCLLWGRNLPVSNTLCWNTDCSQRIFQKLFFWRKIDRRRKIPSGGNCTYNKSMVAAFDDDSATFCSCSIN